MANTTREPICCPIPPKRNFDKQKSHSRSSHLELCLVSSVIYIERLICITGCREMVLLLEIFRRRILGGAQHVGAVDLGRRLEHARDAHRAEIDDLHRPGPVDHHIGRTQVLMQHFLAVEGAQALGDLFDDVACLIEIRRGIVAHPLFEGLAFDEFGHRVEMAAAPVGRRGLEHVGVVDPARTHSSIMKRRR